MKIDLIIRGVEVSVEYGCDKPEPDVGLAGGICIEEVLVTGTKIDLTDWVPEDSEIEAEIIEGITSYLEWVMEP